MNTFTDAYVIGNHDFDRGTFLYASWLVDDGARKWCHSSHNGSSDEATLRLTA
ncbi:MAG: hypothetical protein HC853_13145 [Anaerolineae bacterium]|nr:hypothetical protein [Anaerolineae bacterium]